MSSRWMAVVAAGCGAWLLAGAATAAPRVPALANARSSAPVPAAALSGAARSSAPLPAAALSGAARSSAPVPAAALSGAALRAALQQGGYVVYFRHTATDFSRNDAGMATYEDCANQRPLSPQGQQDAARLGRAIRGMRLPVGERLASPFCRTLEHARLMLGEATPRLDVREAREGEDAGLKRLLAAPVPAGSNRWIVGHGTPFRTVAGPPHLAEGEAAVLRPGGGDWVVVARLPVADWDALASAR